MQDYTKLARGGGAGETKYFYLGPGLVRWARNLGTVKRLVMGATVKMVGARNV